MGVPLLSAQDLKSEISSSIVYSFMSSSSFLGELPFPTIVCAKVSILANLSSNVKRLYDFNLFPKSCMIFSSFSSMRNYGVTIDSPKNQSYIFGLLMGLYTHNKKSFENYPYGICKNQKNDFWVPKDSRSENWLDDFIYLFFFYLNIVKFHKNIKNITIIIFFTIF